MCTPVLNDQYGNKAAFFSTYDLRVDTWLGVATGDLQGRNSALDCTLRHTLTVGSSKLELFKNK